MMVYVYSLISKTHKKKTPKHMLQNKHPKNTCTKIYTITPRNINMEPENTGPPGRGKTSEPRPLFSSSMFIFGGVPVLVYHTRLPVDLRPCHWFESLCRWHSQVHIA